MGKSDHFFEISPYDDAEETEETERERELGIQSC
jgi:hypothetical protein